MEYFSYDDKDHLNQQKNSHQLCNETMHPVLSLMEGKWKLKQQHDQNFPVDGKSSKNKY